ncbi:MAG: GXWXG domain-containing protein [Pseudomonadota bacterium]
MTSKNERMTTAEATALFDQLEPATPEQMIGRWRGEGVDTDHPMDGMLESSYWYGKVFEGPEAVHPLIHKVPLWGRLSVNPTLLPIRAATALPLRDTLAPFLFPVLAPFLRTGRPKARLRCVEFRGRQHAAMVYDAKAIIDVFAQYDRDTLLGWMDCKGMAQPYFFKLLRDD